MITTKLDRKVLSIPHKGQVTDLKCGCQVSLSIQLCSIVFLERFWVFYLRFEIKRGQDILTVAKSLDGQNLRILADSRTVEGYVSQVTESDSRPLYRVVDANAETVDLFASGNYQNAVDKGIVSKVDSSLSIEDQVKEALKLLLK